MTVEDIVREQVLAERPQSDIRTPVARYERTNKLLEVLPRLDFLRLISDAIEQRLKNG